MSDAQSLRDVAMNRITFAALTDAIDHQRRNLAALRAMQPTDSVAMVVTDAAINAAGRTLLALTALQHRARVK